MKFMKYIYIWKNIKHAEKDVTGFSMETFMQRSVLLWGLRSYEIQNGFNRLQERDQEVEVDIL